MSLCPREWGTAANGSFRGGNCKRGQGPQGHGADRFREWCGASAGKEPVLAPLCATATPEPLQRAPETSHRCLPAACGLAGPSLARCERGPAHAPEAARTIGTSSPRAGPTPDRPQGAKRCLGQAGGAPADGGGGARGASHWLGGLSALARAAPLEKRGGGHCPEGGTPGDAGARLASPAPPSRPAARGPRTWPCRGRRIPAKGSVVGPALPLPATPPAPGAGPARAARRLLSPARSRPAPLAPAGAERGPRCRAGGAPHTGRVPGTPPADWPPPPRSPAQRQAPPPPGAIRGGRGMAALQSEPPPASTMLRAGARALLCLALAALLGPPAQAWYKQAAGPSAYSVGRASGLLSGIRRAPHVRRADSWMDSAERRAAPLSPEPPGPALRSTALCVKDLALELPNCQLLSGAPSTIQCKADVTISLDPSDCNST